MQNKSISTDVSITFLGTSNTTTTPTTTTTTTEAPPVPTPTTTTTTTSTPIPILCCTNPTGTGTIFDGSGGGIILSSWTIDWLGHYVVNCKIRVAIDPFSNLTTPLRFYLLGDTGYGEVTISTGVSAGGAVPQTITFSYGGDNAIQGTVYWNGVVYDQALDFGPAWYLEC